MMNNTGLLDKGGIIFASVYLLSLIVIGLIGRYASKENTLSDFYLSGRGIGLFVLFLTLYATQYSGHTLIGFPGKAYRLGYSFIFSVISMMAIIGAYLLYAPKLHILSKKNNFITIGDFIQHRFNSKSFTVLVAIVCIIALANFILTNLKAIGYIVESATGGAVSFEWGIILLSLIMILYETLGGMRSVAWTDAIQGVLLFIGIIAIFVIVQIYFGGLEETAEKIISADVKLWQAPTLEQKNLWLSTIIIFMFGISVYPHAIQRIYSAKNSRVLKRSLQLMIFMPLVTTFFMFVIGITGAAYFPGLNAQESDSITLVMLSFLAQEITGVSILITIFITAAVAAIMSTVDSALLAISSMFTQDIYRKFNPEKKEADYTYIGKLFSWLVMFLMVLLAIYVPQTIWRIMEIKLELLCQISPALFLGIHIKSLKLNAVLWGFVIGTLVAVGIMLLNFLSENIISTKPLGFHAGVWGLVINLSVIYIIQNFKRFSKNFLK